MLIQISYTRLDRTVLGFGSKSDPSGDSSSTRLGCAACCDGLTSATVLFPLFILLLVERLGRVKESEIGIGPDSDQPLVVSEFPPWHHLRGFSEGNLNREDWKFTSSLTLRYFSGITYRIRFNIMA